MTATAFDSDRKVRVLVIQLARLGDTVQSLMALRAAKQLYPQLEIHFAVRSTFAHAAERIPWIEKVVTLPTETLIGDVINGKKDRTETLKLLAQWVSPLIQERWDFVINWTYSEASSYLAALVPSETKLGYSRHEDFSLSCEDDWSSYIQGIIQGGIDQNIHLTDIWTTQLLTALQLQLGEPKATIQESVISKDFFRLFEKANSNDEEILNRLNVGKWIAIQIGTGDSRKSWTADAWGKFAAYLMKRHPEHQIVLLGGPGEVAESEAFKVVLKENGCDESRCIFMVGRTRFDLWTAIVSRVDWVVAADTAVIHLASVLGTRVLNLSIGPVKWWETGPYGNHHYVITKYSTAVEKISPEAAYAVWSFANNEASFGEKKTLEIHFKQLGWSEYLQAVRVYKSRIRSTQDGGGVIYEPIVGHALQAREWLAIVVGQVARAWYCGWIAPIGYELNREWIGPALLKELRQLDEASCILLKVLEEAHRTAVLLSKKATALKSQKLMSIQDKEQIAFLGDKLRQLDELIGRVATNQDPLRIFSQMTKVMMHNLKGQHLSQLGMESARNYQRLIDGVKLYRDWIQHTLKLARPMAVVKQPHKPVLEVTS